MQPDRSRKRLTGIHTQRLVLPDGQQHRKLGTLAVSQAVQWRIDDDCEMPRHQATRNANCGPQPRLNLNERSHLPPLLVFSFAAGLFFSLPVRGRISEKPPSASTWSWAVSPVA